MLKPGYKRAMLTFQIPTHPDWIINVPPTRAGGYEGIGRALAMSERPTAAVCYNDVVAFGALSALGERGIAAGPEFGVVGFDGVAAIEHSNPPLSTVGVEPSHLGEIAAGILLKRLREPDAAPLKHLAMPQLIVRQSSIKASDH